MTGLAIVIPRSGSGPVVPPPLYDLGVAGYDRRFEAERLTAGAVSIWADTGSAPLPLTIKSGSTGTVTKRVADDSGLDGYVRIDNTAGSISLTDNAPIAGGSRTIATVCRLGVGTTLSAGPFVKHAGVTLERASNASPQAKGGTGSLTVSGAPLTLATKWQFVLLTVDGTAPVLRGAAVETTALTGTWAVTTASALELTFPYTSGTPRAMDFASYVEFPRLLTSTERNTLYAAYQSRFTSLAL